MACPPGCVRTPGHEGFHTTHRPPEADQKPSELSEDAARNELAAIRLYLESCGLEEGESIIHFLRGWKQNGAPVSYRDGRERLLRP